MMIAKGFDVALPFDTSWYALFLQWMIQYPDLVHRFLEAKLERTLQDLGAIGKVRGVDGVMGGVDWAYSRGPFFSPKHFEEFVVPRLRRLTSCCHDQGMLYIKHTDGNIGPFLELFVQTGVDGYQAIEPQAGMRIADLKRRYGHLLTLCGNVDCAKTLVYGTEEEVRKETRAVIDAAASGGGFTLTSSNTIHSGVKPDNYFAMLDEAKSVAWDPSY